MKGCEKVHSRCRRPRQFRRHPVAAFYASDAYVSVGGHGESRTLELELKLIADVGLVGFPNAGKSSFLGAVSKVSWLFECAHCGAPLPMVDVSIKPYHPCVILQAKPKVADYPFTTLHPTVGVVSFRDNFTLSIADIPGIIEGAHADRGLGLEFLRHIERTKILVYVLDVSLRGGDVRADLCTLQQELRAYDPTLLQRPSFVVANKTDVPGTATAVNKLRAATSLPVIEVSALTGHNVGTVINSLRWLMQLQLDAERKAAAASSATP